ncbi:hypothetical protein [Arthrobacter sp. Soil762]|uniref:hypothetical protein n=1 Tax=Arthrobacter sp. Soil762 TaxID=1736401 RepID=UPI000A6633E4|nr:hypothetical protein [Arthrobacter sp. Soil762]
MEPIRAILLPGSVLPAQPAYGALIEALGPGVDAVAKDLELYAGDAPPPGWTLDTEAVGVLREAGGPRLEGVPSGGLLGRRRRGAGLCRQTP